jgi:hypothetical protein
MPMATGFAVARTWTLNHTSTVVVGLDVETAFENQRWRHGVRSAQTSGLATSRLTQGLRPEAPHLARMPDELTATIRFRSWYSVFTATCRATYPHQVPLRPRRRPTRLHGASFSHYRRQ